MDIYTALGQSLIRFVDPSIGDKELSLRYSEAHANRHRDL